MFTNKCSPSSPLVVVSDPANVTRPVFDNGETNGLSDAQSEETERVDAALGAFIEQLDCFPTPWGLKIAAEARGLANARFPFPLSDERVEQAQAFGQWFREHSSKFNVQ